MFQLILLLPIDGRFNHPIYSRIVPVPNSLLLGQKDGQIKYRDTVEVYLNALDWTLPGPNHQLVDKDTLLVN